MDPPKPFFSRSYGGYSEDQFRWLQNRRPLESRTIWDPMGGQAYHLSALAQKSSKLFINDINPALLLLAFLRNPKSINNHINLCSRLEDILRDGFALPSLESSITHSENWISDKAAAELKSLFKLAELDKLKNPFTSGWRVDRLDGEREFQIFVLAIIVFSARSLIAYTQSRNVTWTKKGGYTRYSSIADPIRAALQNWKRYSEEAIRNKILKNGKIIIETNSIQESLPNTKFTPDTIITSPPYANRLDYSSMWGPEANLLSFLYNVETSTLKKQQIGSIVVRGSNRNIDLEWPPQILESLEKILVDDKSHGSANYYFPFFVNYTRGIWDSMRNITSLKCAPGTKFFVFVRDTARKNVLFQTGLLTTRAIERNSNYVLVESHEEVIGSHIGMKRIGRDRQNLVGLSQREWWLEFEAK